LLRAPRRRGTSEVCGAGAVELARSGARGTHEAGPLLSLPLGCLGVDAAMERGVPGSSEGGTERAFI
jgi:hypothetical protein